jgi:hypothetical protein
MPRARNRKFLPRLLLKLGQSKLGPLKLGLSKLGQSKLDPAPRTLHPKLSLLLPSVLPAVRQQAVAAGAAEVEAEAAVDASRP